MWCSCLNAINTSRFPPVAAPAASVRLASSASIPASLPPSGGGAVKAWGTRSGVDPSGCGVLRNLRCVAIGGRVCSMLLLLALPAIFWAAARWAGRAAAGAAAAREPLQMSPGADAAAARPQHCPRTRMQRRALEPLPLPLLLCVQRPLQLSISLRPIAALLRLRCSVRERAVA
jgi:hypothetical protein